MTLASRPLAGPFTATPRLPGDKSITHRAYLLGGFAAGETRVIGGNPGADCAHTLRAMETLGAAARRDGDVVVLRGVAGRCRAPAAPLDLGNAGTGFRLLLGLLAGQAFTATLTGDASLSRRPMERVLDPLRRMGAVAGTVDGHPPVTLTGGPLRGIRHRLPVASAQVRSAVLFAGMQAEGETVVLGGAGARDHTERMLPVFGIPLRRSGDTVAVSGPRIPQGTSVRVPGDPSAAVFHAVAAALVPGSQVMLENMGLNPFRIGAFRVLERMGLAVHGLPAAPEPEGPGEPSGRLRIEGGKLQGVEIAPEEVPGLIDELPALAVAAAFAEGRTRVRGAGELRHKESDRLSAMAAGLAAIGARVTLHEDGWTLDGTGGGPLAGGEVDPRGDHRVAMAFLVAGLASRSGVRLRGEDAIGTSDPFFLGALEALGGLVRAGVP